MEGGAWPGAPANIAEALRPRPLSQSPRGTEAGKRALPGHMTRGTATCAVGPHLWILSSQASLQPAAPRTSARWPVLLEPIVIAPGRGEGLRWLLLEELVEPRASGLEVGGGRPPGPLAPSLCPSALRVGQICALRPASPAPPKHRPCSVWRGRVGLLPPARGSKSALGCHLGRRAGCRGLWPQADRVGVEVGAEPVSRLTQWPGFGPRAGPGPLGREGAHFGFGELGGLLGGPDPSSCRF